MSLGILCGYDYFYISIKLPEYILEGACWSPKAPQSLWWTASVSLVFRSLTACVS